MKSIFFVVCDNGLGHLIRVLNYINELKRLDKLCQFHIACTKKQIIKLKLNNYYSKFLNKNIKFHDDVFKTNLNLLSINKPFSWYKKLKYNKDFNSADLIISDNLPQILNLRSDTILSGSFLWSLVLKNNKKNSYYNKFCEEEKKLLKKFKPEMLVVRKIYMNELKKYVKIIPLNWVADGKRKLQTYKNNNKKNIGIFIGNTGQDQKLIERFITKILNLKLNYNFYVGYNLYEKFKDNSKVKLFNFKKKKFDNLSLAICRPGLGTVQSLILHSIPMFIYSNDLNLEIISNTKKLVKLGLAKRIDLRNFKDTLYQIESNSILVKLKKKYLNEKTNGAFQAANYILNRLKK